jgi:hypothetical protein
VDPRVAAIAASLRELAKPAPLEPKPAPEMRPRPQPQPEVEHVIEHILAVGHAEKHQLRFEEARAPGWRKPAVIAGSLVAGVGLLGALVGLTAREADEAKPAAPTALAVPKPAPEIATAAPEPAATLPPDQAEIPLPSPAAATLPKRIHIPQQTPAAKPADAPAVQTAPEQTAPDALASDPLAPAAAASTPAAAAMPLPRNVIARTIERIGYACGEVSSTVASEGAGPGVYTVTCSSGQTYQATPVHGRYHFRRAPTR